MKSKMFGHRKRSGTERSPGKPAFDMDDSYGKSKDNPPSYEGKEHVKYKNPGFSSHEIKYPEDEPHMKGHVGKEEMHEMEDNFHMDVPDQTEDTLEAKLKRARMSMDAPNQEDPKPMMGNMVRNVGAKGVKDEDGEEDMGPNDMQSGRSKEDRKKMIVAVTRKKMSKKAY